MKSDLLNSKQNLLRDIGEEAFLHIDKIKTYTSQRNLNHADIQRFQLGYLPDTKTILKTLKTKNWSADLAIQISLETKILSLSGSSYLSLIANRLLFPIFDVYGRYEGLAGRALNDEQKPKYFNTVFQKGKHLYGLNIAFRSILEKNFAIIVEGYMDVIAAHQIGISNVVGIMGTAFSYDHSILLSRYTKNAILLLDQDEAGKKSTQKHLKQAPNQLILKLTAASIPDGHKDLDEFINKNKNAAINFLNKTS